MVGVGTRCTAVPCESGTVQVGTGALSREVWRTRRNARLPRCSRNRSEGKSSCRPSRLSRRDVRDRLHCTPTVERGKGGAWGVRGHFVVVRPTPLPTSPPRPFAPSSRSGLRAVPPLRYRRGGGHWRSQGPGVRLAQPRAETIKRPCSRVPTSPGAASGAPTVPVVADPTQASRSASARPTSHVRRCNRSWRRRCAGPQRRWPRPCCSSPRATRRA